MRFSFAPQIKSQNTIGTSPTWSIMATWPTPCEYCGSSSAVTALAT